MLSLLAEAPYQVLVLLGSALVTVFKSIAFVQEGQRGVKLRFGKAVRHRTRENADQPKIVAPGFVFMIPFIDKLKRREPLVHWRPVSYQRAESSQPISCRY
jgi:regulator of protease activity HflC (stomatin/prohibitin superfamily)